MTGLLNPSLVEYLSRGRPHHIRSFLFAKLFTYDENSGGRACPYDTLAVELYSIVIFISFFYLSIIVCFLESMARIPQKVCLIQLLFINYQNLPTLAFELVKRAFVALLFSHLFSFVLPFLLIGLP